ncbi:hypothetical protein QO014_002381 [Kaistia dalseonensis]|uniref:Uncharacterized protein n=1 Tax=Kaistia dalseonensis TaxID=410840 RepID=A0ABU0H6R1_9HYPH|nr:hypothetical protein [Kaistia dalseonensis]
MTLWLSTTFWLSVTLKAAALFTLTCLLWTALT